MPNSLRRSRLPAMPLVPVITAEIAVDPSGRYEGLPHFSHFGDHIRFPGGVNRPKLIQAPLRPLHHYQHSGRTERSQVLWAADCDRCHTCTDAQVR